MKASRNWGISVYFVAVLVAVGLLFGITAIPGNSAELFPNPSPEDLVQVFQWVWEGACEGPAMNRSLDER